MPQGERSPHAIEVVWEGGRRYRGGPVDGPTLVMDGNREVAPSPVDGILVSLGTCSAIDVVDILEKRRTPVTSLRASIEFSRALTPPRRLTDIVVRFTVATASERHHVERAIELSFEKYCSVSASLAPDTTLSWTLEIRPAAAGPEAG